MTTMTTIAAIAKPMVFLDIWNIRPGGALAGGTCISYGAGLSAIRAAAARVGSPPLFAVLVYVADEHKAFETSARALFVIVGCSVEGIAGRRYSVFDQGHTPPWSGLRGVCSTCGAIPFQQPHTTILSKYVKQCTITADGKLHSGGVKCRRCMRNTGH